ncbi:MAG TPA: hypothetical protein VGB49_04970 [Caulobacteraceae bacterium]|jgi:hypothetical protein
MSHAVQTCRRLPDDEFAKLKACLSFASRYLSDRQLQELAEGVRLVIREREDARFGTELEAAPARA